MNENLYLSLTPRDPLIARDGRPFGNGLRMRSLDWFYPSVLAGSLRTMLGRLDGGFPDARTPEYIEVTNNLKRLSVAGPFPEVDGQVYFPAPQDITVRRNSDAALDAFAARPVDLSKKFPGGGCNLPAGLDLALLPDEIAAEFKPEQAPTLWSWERMTAWLVNATGHGFFPTGMNCWPDGFLKSPKKDLRTHVQMEFGSGAAKDGMLFQSTGLAVEQFCRASGKQPDDVLKDRLTVRIGHSGEYRHLLERLDEWHPLGGERRLIRWQPGKQAAWWVCPERLRKVFSQENIRLVRLVLATPGLFDDGWKPGWLKRDTAPSQSTYLTGEIPKTGVRVRLISACVDRWRPISGWGYEPYNRHTAKNEERLTFGPKPLRRLVPAGSVYFFQVISGNSAKLADHWLTSVCDKEQDRLDGFGLALWGVWQPFEPDPRFES